MIHPHTLRLTSEKNDILQAASMLKAGQLVAFPTETVYGLGGDATSPHAVAGIFSSKGRPSFNPLIAHVPSLMAAQREALFDKRAEKLAEAFWPGSLTLVLPVRDKGSVCELARAGLPSIALRIPSHPVALELLNALDIPIAGPSANRSGHVSPTTAEHVFADLKGKIAAIVDGGACPVGVESTILACFGAKTILLRAGGVSREAIEDVLGEKLEKPEIQDHLKPIAPGMLTSHYAPQAQVRLFATSVKPGEAVLLFGSQKPEGFEQAVTSINLSEAGDTVEAAAKLYGALRELDASGAEGIAVMPIPEQGLGEAINDRLQRAAAEKDKNKSYKTLS